MVRDLYWTKVFLGDSDTDDLLETGERVELTIILKGLANATPLVTDLDFSLEIKPAIGAVLVIQFALLVSGPPIRTRGRSDTLAT